MASNFEKVFDNNVRPLNSEKVLLRVKEDLISSLIEPSYFLFGFDELSI